MRIIQTDKRIVTHIITDVNELSYDDVKYVLEKNSIPHEGFFLETKSGIAYVWMTKTHVPPQPMLPLDSITA